MLDTEDAEFAVEALAAGVALLRVSVLRGGEDVLNGQHKAWQHLAAIERAIFPDDPGRSHQTWQHD